MMQATLRYSDDIIRKKIYDRFYWDAQLDDFANISVSVTSGRVTLSGSAPTIASRKQAEADAYTIDGVQTVGNQLAVKINTTMKIPSDRDVGTALWELLRWNSRTDMSSIHMNVNSGYVIIMGTVRSYYEKFRIQELAQGMVGVIAVDNRLTVVPNSSEGDEEIGSRIIKDLKTILGSDVDRITVMVRKGIVTLTGTVRDMLAFNAVSTIVRSVRGIVDVHTHLSVHEGE